MDYGLLKFFHILGAVLMGGGLIGVWMSDLRSRQLHELKSFSGRPGRCAEVFERNPRLLDGCVAHSAALYVDVQPERLKGKRVGLRRRSCQFAARVSSRPGLQRQTKVYVAGVRQRLRPIHRADKFRDGAARLRLECRQHL